jgi:hypothetical protein
VRDENGLVVALQDQIRVIGAGNVEDIVTLPPIRELFRGTAKPGDLSRGPTTQLEPFFLMLEATVAAFCVADGRDESDQEMAIVYSELRRRPDKDGGRLSSYVRAAAQLYMSARPVSQAEYDAVMGRLARSARTFSDGAISRNYLTTLRETFKT